MKSVVQTTHMPQKASETLKFLAAWLFLNGLMSLNWPAPGGAALHWLKISPEMLFIVAALIPVAARKPTFPRAALVLTIVLVLVLRLFRLGEVVVPMYLNRALNIYIDMQYLPGLLHLLKNTLSGTQLATWAILLSSALVAAVWGIRLSLCWLWDYLAGSRQRRFRIGTIALVVLGWGLNPIGLTEKRPAWLLPPLMPRLVQEIDFMLHVGGYRSRDLQRINASQKRVLDTPSSLDRLKGADVYLIFVESYGEFVFASNPGMFPQLAPDIALLERRLAAADFRFCSGFFSSPTFGGASWLAHGSLVSGVHLDTQLAYNLMVTSDTPTLIDHFNRVGYRSVSVMPCTEWLGPEDAFYRYQTKYIAGHFPYRGSTYGWSPMTDQYALDYIARREINRRQQPLFIEFVLGSSHAPFNRQPRYIEDWSDIGDGSIYTDLAPVVFPVVWPDLSNAAEAYQTAIRYELKTLSGFLLTHVDNNTLVIILGDHQPNLQITGPDRPWSVPVHVISRKPALLKPFYRMGFKEGMVPRQPPPHPPMGEFLFKFLEGFSSH